MSSRIRVAATLVLFALAPAASAQVQRSWESLLVDPGTANVGAKSIVRAGTSEDWFVGGHRFADSPDLPSIVYSESGPLIQRVGSGGQLLWSVLPPVPSSPFGTSGGPVALASDPAGDARFAFSSNTGGVVLERRAGATGAVVWSVPGPAGSLGIVPGSLVVLPDGRQRVAFVSGLGTNSSIGYATHSDGGAQLQSTSVVMTGISATSGAADPASGRIAAAASVSTSLSMVLVVAPDGSLAWSNATVDFSVRALALGPGGVLAAAGQDAQSWPRFRLFDASGAVIGDHQLAAPSSSWTDVAFDPWGEVVAAGTAGADASIARFTSAGTLLWHRTWDGPSNQSDSFAQVTALASGEYVAAGLTSLTPSTPSHQFQGELLAVGWRRNGDVAWTHRDPTQSTDVEFCSDLAEVPSTGSVLVGGWRGRNAFVNPGYVPLGVHLVALRPQASPFCFGDAVTTSACPCGNASAPGAQQGCLNSTGVGAHLADAGVASIGADSLNLTVSGLPPTATCLVFHGTSRQLAAFGDGVRCVGGSVTRLFAVQASGGVATVPPPGDTVSARSTAGGDPLAPGTLRWMQAYYRNVDPNFCVPAARFNASSGLILTWAP